MEQPCYKCGLAVEEGTPFCPHCTAPQIRVIVAEPVEKAREAEGTMATASANLPASQTVPVLAVPMQWSQAIGPCALSALVACLLMAMHLYPVVALPSAGFLAVVFYRARQGAVGGMALAGARLGALSGLLCFIIPTLFLAVGAAIPDIRTKIREQILENIQNVAASRPGDAQFQATLQQLKTPEGLVAMLILASILALMLGALGGALGGAIFGRRDRQ